MLSMVRLDGGGWCVHRLTCALVTGDKPMSQSAYSSCSVDCLSVPILFMIVFAKVVALRVSVKISTLCVQLTFVFVIRSTQQERRVMLKRMRVLRTQQRVVFLFVVLFCCLVCCLVCAIPSCALVCSPTGVLFLVCLLLLKQPLCAVVAVFVLTSPSQMSPSLARAQQAGVAVCPLLLC
jgi:hypothetical protein